MSAIRKRRPLDLVDRIRDQALAAKRQRVPVVEEAAASPADSTAENSTPDSGLRRSARLRTRTASPISYKVPEEDEVEVVEGATPGLQALNERNRLPSQRRAKGSGTRRGKARARKDAEDAEPPRSAGSQRGTARKGKARQPAVAPAPASTTAGSTPSPAPKRKKKSAEKEGTRSSPRRGGNSLPEVECYPLDAVESEMALSRFDVGTEQLGETGKDGTTLLVTDLETGEKLAMKQFKVSARPRRRARGRLRHPAADAPRPSPYGAFLRRSIPQKAKSGAMVRKEAMAQAQAAAQGAAPAVIGFRTSGAVKFIVMRKMERTAKEALKDGSWMPSDEAQVRGRLPGQPLPLPVAHTA